MNHATPIAAYLLALCRRHSLTHLSVAAAIALGGCGGGGGGGGGYSTPPDTMVPTATLSAPSSVVSRTVTLSATASDDTGIAEVRFLVDGTVIGTDTSAPYSFDWNTATLAEGPHTVRVEARDAAGNAGVSANASVEVDNVRSYSVSLSGTAEVPVRATGASGTAQVTINLGTGAISGDLTVNGMVATDAHIHDGYAGVNGPIAVGMTQNATTSSQFAFPANATLTSVQVDHLLSGGLYLNAHSAAYPGGEIRGQVLPPGFAVAVLSLSGANEAPAVDTAVTGTAGITYETATRRVFAHLTLAGRDDATDAHVHRAYAGSNGPIVVGLSRDTTNPAHWFVNDTALSQADFDALLAGELYFNAHNVGHPAGEVRGQIIPGGIELIGATLSSLQEVPSHASAGAGIAAFTLNPTTLAFTAHLNLTGADDATAAHIHEAVAGTNGPVRIDFTRDAANARHWSASGTLSQPLATALRTGRLYVNAHTPAHPGGEVRGQLAPQGVYVAFTSLNGGQQVPVNATAASGTGAVTVDTTNGTVTVHVRTSGASDATAAHIHRGFAGENGGVTVNLSVDAADAAHWLVENAPLTAEQQTDFLAGRHYLNVHTPASPAGLIRGQLAPSGIEVLFTAMDNTQVVPPAATAASGTAATTIDLRTRAFVTHANTAGLVGGTVGGVNQGAAGANGPVVAALTQDAAVLTHWFTPAITLTSAQFAAYHTRGLYAVLDGVLRGQISPPDVLPPAISVRAPATPVTGTVTLNASAVDDRGVVAVRFLVNGTQIGATDTASPYSVSWDSTAAANGNASLTAEAADAAGNLTMSAPVTVAVTNAAADPFPAIQASVFGPRCSGCHTGPTGNLLPGGLNLTSASDSFNALVNVSSLEQPGVMRVVPGDPDGSYLVRKLEGSAGIAGARMPLGGPYLDQATINQIRAWIAALPANPPGGYPVYKP